MPKILRRKRGKNKENARFFLTAGVCTDSGRRGLSPPPAAGINPAARYTKSGAAGFIPAARFIPAAE
jgi:hypothetical protein